MSEPNPTPATFSLESLLGWNTRPNPERGWWWFPSPARQRVGFPCDPLGWPAALRLVETPRKRLAASCLLRAFRLLRRSPDAGGPASGTPLDQWLEEIWPGMSLRYAVYRGTPNIFVKDSLQCQRPDGTVVGYVKIPRGKRAGEAVANEAAALRTLGERLPSESFYPRLLGERCPLTAQSAPAETDAAMTQTAAAARVLRCLASNLSRPFAWAGSPQRHDIARAIAVIAKAGHSERGARLADSLARLDRELGDEPLAHSFSHGDMVPWNFTPGGFLFDWEWAGYRLPLHDAFHHLWMPLILADRPVDPRLLWEVWQREGGVFGPRPAAAPGDALLARAYLTWQSSFYDAATIENGDPIGSSRLLDRLHELVIDPPGFRR